MQDGTANIQYVMSQTALLAKHMYAVKYHIKDLPAFIVPVTI